MYPGSTQNTDLLRHLGTELPHRVGKSHLDHVFIVVCTEFMKFYRPEPKFPTKEDSGYMRLLENPRPCSPKEVLVTCAAEAR